MIGRSLAHYSITEKLGQGGMGEVYRATDTRLNRDVAIKLLPESFIGDVERIARFSREAQVLASLKHPNIAVIHGLEEHEGKQALVLELIEGRTLAERIRQGVLPLREALGIALQIAEALESAHERGIVHRDLKPANVKITPEGTVKVLDFGLAKALEKERPEQDLASSPTISMAATQAGLILGTAAYMSPEQARGKMVDRRADIWSFGVILWEMLTGKAAFEGEDISQILAAVIMKDLEPGDLPASVPSRVRDLLGRCLRKDPQMRLRDIGDARIAVQEYLADPAAAAEGAEAPLRPPLPKRLLGSVAAATLLAGLALGLWLQPQPQPEPAVHLEVILSSEKPLMTGAGNIVVSSDGRSLAYGTGEASTPESRRLEIRTLDQLEGEELPGTIGAYNPFFSPDGRWVGYVTLEELKKVSVSGGAPLTLCPVDRNRGADWGPNGQIVFTQQQFGGLKLVSAAGGEPQELTTLQEGEVSHRWPRFLPDGQKVLFTVLTSAGPNEARIEVVDLESSERKVIHTGGTFARYAHSGHLLYAKDNTLFAAPFDLDSLEMTELPAPVLQNLMTNVEGGAQYDVSPDGTLVYLTGTAQNVNIRRTLIWGGEPQPVTERRRDYNRVRVSPDGTRIALDVFEDNKIDVWVHDVTRDTQTRLTFHDGADLFPVWSPDGRWIAFASAREGSLSLHRRPADGSTEAELLAKGEHSLFPSSFSPDGRHLAYWEQHPDTSEDLWIMQLDGEAKAQPFLQSPFREVGPMFSPDGRWIAYQSNESGRDEIYVRPFPGPGGKWQISSNGGAVPRWSRDGRRLHFRQGPSIMAVDIRAEGESLQAGNPQKILEAPLGDYVFTYDVAHGNRLLVVRNEQSPQAAGQTHAKIVLNWFGDLTRMLNTSP